MSNVSFKLSATASISLERVEASLNSRLMINQAGKFTLEIVRVSEPLFNENIAIEGTKIVNFKAWTPTMQTKATDLVLQALSLNESDPDAAGKLVQEALNCRLSTNVLPGSAMYDKVTQNGIVYGMVSFQNETKTGEPVNDFRINNLSEVPVQDAKRGRKISFQELLEAKSAESTTATVTVGAEGAAAL